MPTEQAGPPVLLDGFEEFFKEAHFLIRFSTAQPREEASIQMRTVIINQRNQGAGIEPGARPRIELPAHAVLLRHPQAHQSRTH